MQHLNTLTQVANAASALAELTRKSTTYRFNVMADTTFYLDVSQAEVRLLRHPAAQIEVTMMLQAPFAWRVVTDQDEAGVYVVAKLRPVVGGLAGALFSVVVPDQAHLVLKLQRCRLCLEAVDSTLQIPPVSMEMAITPV
jgi:glutamate synthase domain-containing protein 1